MSQPTENKDQFTLPSSRDDALMDRTGAPGAGEFDGGTNAMSTTIATTLEQTRATADLTTQLAALLTMSVGELAERYREVYGEPTRSRNKDYLRKKVAWRIQEQAEGGLTPRALARIAELAPGAPVRWRTPMPAFPPAVEAPAEPEPPPLRDPRLPPVGTVLVREHQGTLHSATVLAEGFEYAGERFPSLSAIARRITGTPWNGYLFFNLERRSRRAATEAAGAVG